MKRQTQYERDIRRLLQTTQIDPKQYSAIITICTTVLRNSREFHHEIQQDPMDFISRKKDAYESRLDKQMEG